jgi:inner membrane protein
VDPFTQGALGAAFAQAACRSAQPAQPQAVNNLRAAGVLGFLAGMAADLDVLIRSATDPLITLEYHRHFTHALTFIPVGGLICALALVWIVRRRWPLDFAHALAFCILGYATHGLLDAATSYGTSLLWPFSHARISWSLVSVIDPLFTVPLAALCFASWRAQRPFLARLALGWGALYLATAMLQQSAALQMAVELAAARGHTPLRIEAKPSFGNILVWKIITETPERFYIDAARVGLRPRAFDGVSVPKLDLARDLPWLDPASQQAADIERFRFFSGGFVAQDPVLQNRIIDIRYSFIPNNVSALWSIEVTPDAALDAHARYVTHRNNARAGMQRMVEMIVDD